MATGKDFPNAGVSAIAQHLRHIRHLELLKAIRMGDEDILAMSLLPHLSHVVLQGSLAVTDAGMQAMASRMAEAADGGQLSALHVNG